MSKTKSFVSKREHFVESQILITYYSLERRMKPCRFRNRWIRLWIRKFWIFANINSLFYPFLVYTLYLAFGPWFVGDLIDGRMGVVFVWGTYFEGGTYLSGTMTYFNGFLHVFFFNLILVVIIAHAADVR